MKGIKIISTFIYQEYVPSTCIVGSRIRGGSIFDITTMGRYSIRSSTGCICRGSCRLRIWWGILVGMIVIIIVAVESRSLSHFLKLLACPAQANIYCSWLSISGWWTKWTLEKWAWNHWNYMQNL